MAVVSALGRARDGLKRVGISNEWWLQHTHDQLTGLGVRWAQYDANGDDPSQHLNVWLLREDASDGRLLAIR